MRGVDAVDEDRPVVALRTRARALVVAPMLAGSLLAGGCAPTAADDLCTQYADLAESVAQVQDLDVQDTSAQDVRDLVDEVLADLDQLRATADTQYAVLVSRLRTALVELRQAAVDLDETDLAVAVPLLVDSVTTTADEYRRLAD